MQQIIEIEFLFDQLQEHLQNWNEVPFVHIYLDDTRIINRIEYDSCTDRFIGFCLPLKNGLPLCDTFVFHTFGEIKDALEKEGKGK